MSRAEAALTCREKLFSMLSRPPTPFCVVRLGVSTFGQVAGSRAKLLGESLSCQPLENSTVSVRSRVAGWDEHRRDCGGHSGVARGHVFAGRVEQGLVMPGVHGALSSDVHRAVAARTVAQIAVPVLQAAEFSGIWVQMGDDFRECFFAGPWLLRSPARCQVVACGSRNCFLLRDDFWNMAPISCWIPVHASDTEAFGRVAEIFCVKVDSVS